VTELETLQSLAENALESLAVDAQLSVPLVREFMDDISEFLLEQPQVDIPITHHFSKAVYAREMKVPKGILVLGKIHKFENLNILSKGEVSVLSVDGVMRVKAPHTFVASPGAQRLIFAHEDVVWTTIHGTEETDVDKIEQQFIAKTYEEVNYVLDASSDSGGDSVGCVQSKEAIGPSAGY